MLDFLQALTPPERTHLKFYHEHNSQFPAHNPPKKPGEITQITHPCSLDEQISLIQTMILLQKQGCEVIDYAAEEDTETFFSTYASLCRIL